MNIVVLLLLAAVCFRIWRHRRAEPARWSAIGFGGLGLLFLTRGVLPDDPGGALWIVEKVLLALAVAFPYFLYRFTTSFGKPSAGVDLAVKVFAGLVVAMTLGLPSLPVDVEPRPTWFRVYVGFVLGHWVLLSGLAAAWLWVGGRDQPRVAKRRMQTLSLATVLLSLGILIAGIGPGDRSPGLDLAFRLSILFSALLFFVGFAPPAILRVLWRQPELDRLRRAITELMRARDEREIGELLLPPVTALVAGERATLLDEDGHAVASYSLERHGAQQRRRAQSQTDAKFMLQSGGSLRIRASAYTPFFGRDEIDLLQSLAALTDIALERVRAARREAQIVETRKELIEVVAHDLRSPLGIVTAMAEMLVDKWETLEPQQRMEMVQAVHRQAATLGRLLEDVLDMVRVESGELHYDVQPFDLREMIRSAIVELEKVATREFHVAVPDDLPLALADENRQRQILTNLLSNAMKFSPPETPIDVVASPGASTITVAVHDHGAGIDSEEMPKLFKKFSRLRQPADVGYVPGTGLGLYICKKMVEAQGGEIHVDSAVGRGSVFSYTVRVA